MRVRGCGVYDLYGNVPSLSSLSYKKLRIPALNHRDDRCLVPSLHVPSVPDHCDGLIDQSFDVVRRHNAELVCR